MGGFIAFNAQWAVVSLCATVDTLAPFSDSQKSHTRSRSFLHFQCLSRVGFMNRCSRPTHLHGFFNSWVTAHGHPWDDHAGSLCEYEYFENQQYLTSLDLLHISLAEVAWSLLAWEITTGLGKNSNSAGRNQTNKCIQYSIFYFLVHRVCAGLLGHGYHLPYSKENFSSHQCANHSVRHLCRSLQLVHADKRADVLFYFILFSFCELWQILSLSVSMNCLQYKFLGPA